MKQQSKSTMSHKQNSSSGARALDLSLPSWSLRWTRGHVVSCVMTSLHTIVTALVSSRLRISSRTLHRAWRRAPAASPCCVRLVRFDSIRFDCLPR